MLKTYLYNAWVGISTKLELCGLFSQKEEALETPHLDFELGAFETVTYELQMISISATKLQLSPVEKCGARDTFPYGALLSHSTS